MSHIILENARAQRKALLVAVPSLDDKVASTAADLFPKLKEDDSLVEAGTRINWNGVLKRAAVALWDTKENNPDNAPTLWEDIEYRNGIRNIPEVITSTLAFKLDELGWWKGKVYKSLRDGNSYNPDVTPEWWEVVEEGEAV